MTPDPDARAVQHAGPEVEIPAGEVVLAGTLLLDLLTEPEARVDLVTRALRFDIELLTDRLVEAVRWAVESGETRDLRIGCFGSSTGAAAALGAAARAPEIVAAVVSRGGRPDLTPAPLSEIRTPTLLIVGSRDETVLELNRNVLAELAGKKELEVVPGATHLFEEEGKLERVAELARDWFLHRSSAARPFRSGPDAPTRPASDGTGL